MSQVSGIQTRCPYAVVMHMLRVMPMRSSSELGASVVSATVLDGSSSVLFSSAESRTHVLGQEDNAALADDPRFRWC